MPKNLDEIKTVPEIYYWLSCRSASEGISQLEKWRRDIERSLTLLVEKKERERFRQECIDAIKELPWIMQKHLIDKINAIKAIENITKEKK